MKNLLVKIIFIGVLIIGIIDPMKAQVTIGSGYPAEKAAILEIKNQEADPSTNITSTKGGLGLPRVKLIDVETLEPFIQKTDDAWNLSNQTTTKIKHAGLMVYNLEDKNGFSPNVYIWDGALWKPIGSNSQKYFYIPSFNIPLPEAGQKVSDFDLYAQYEMQFKGTNGSFISSNTALTNVPAKPDGSIYEREELDYVITYYDKAVIKEGSISLSNSGKLSFEVLSRETTPASFLNIAFVIK